MKTRINLLIKQTKYLEFEKFFQKVKTGIVFLIFIFLAVYAFSFVILLRQKQNLDELQQEKKALLEYLMQNKDIEAKFVYFRNKEKQLSEILKEDVNFYPYYNLLTDSLKSASSESRLESVVIDKNKAVSFTVSFKDYAGQLEFLKFTESDEFLNNFNELILSNFSSDKSTKTSYQLNLQGVFKTINGN